MRSTNLLLLLLLLLLCCKPQPLIIIIISRDSSSENIKEHNTLLNFPYIHSHIQSHSPRAPPWPSPPAFCGLVLPVNQYVRGRFSRLTFLPLELSTNIIQVVYLQNRSTTLWVIKKKQDTLIIILLNVDRLSTFFLYSGLSGKRFRTNHTSNASSLYYLVRRKCQESSDNLKEVSCFTIKLSLP